jgi:hypothetical protein
MTYEKGKFSYDFRVNGVPVIEEYSAFSQPVIAMNLFETGS